MPNTARHSAETKIYEFMDTLDPTGYNTKHYRNLFQSLSDTEFDKYMKDMANVENFNMYYELNSLGFKEKGYPSMRRIREVATKYKVKLTETVFMPHKRPESPESPPSTSTPVPILLIPIRRLQQMVDKKNAAVSDNDTVNPIIGQVTGESKAASLSDMQTCSLATSNQIETIKEFLGPRADDQESKSRMLELIEQYGEVNLSDLNIKSSNKQSLNTTRVFMIGAGFNFSYK